MRLKGDESGLEKGQVLEGAEAQRWAFAKGLKEPENVTQVRRARGAGCLTVTYGPECEDGSGWVDCLACGDGWPDRDMWADE